MSLQANGNLRRPLGKSQELVDMLEVGGSIPSPPTNPHHLAGI
jgi:hypothetical protein